MGQIARRYLSVMITFPFAIILLGIAYQIFQWESTGNFVSLGEALSSLLASVPKFLIFFTGVSIIQSNFEWIAINFTKLSGVSQSAALLNVNLFMDTIFLGNDDTFLLLPILFFLSFGIAAMINFILEILIRIISLPFLFLCRFDKLYIFVVNRFFSLLSLFLLFLLTNRIFVKQFRILMFGLILAAIVTTICILGPFHLAFIVAFISHLLSCVRSFIIYRKSVSLVFFFLFFFLLFFFSSFFLLNIIK